MPPTGNSFLRVFDATTPASPTLLQSINSGGTFRVDEMAYSPLTHQVLAANNADTPAFGNLYQTTLGTTPVSIGHGPVSIPAAQGGIPGGGLEQPVWNPTTGTFFISVPALAGTNNPGGVAEISTAGVVLRTIDFGTMGITSCSPTGLALGGSGNLMVGCGNVGAAAILLNPAGAGSIVKTFAGLGGTDELWYDPTTKEFYVTGNNNTNTTRFFDIVTDAPLGGNIIQTVDLPTTTSAHSITVDPLTGDVFVALAGTANIPGTPGVNPCPVTFANPGCIEVFAQVPEPGSLPLLVVGLTGLIGFAVRRRVHTG
jgi:hypothetical protein